MSGRAVVIDGRLVDPAAAVVSVYDRGFLFGDGVFEVLRTYGGVPFALAEHLRRLRESARRVLIELPVDDATLEAEVRLGMEAAGPPDHYVRIVVTRGGGPIALDLRTATTPLRVVFVEPVSPPPREAYAEGIEAATVRTRRTVDETPAEGAKVTAYLPNVLALHEALSRGAKEALVVDGRGSIVEGASSNLFVVRDGQVWTPPVTAGILAGITRAHLLGVAATLGIPVVERLLYPEDLAGADEVFITSSIREVCPVVRVDGRRVAKGLPGPVTRALHRGLREEAGVGGLPMPWE